MVYLKCFELGKYCVMLVPRRSTYAVRAINYKSPRYKGYVKCFSDYKYDVANGTLAECNDIFNLEVSYLMKMYDELIFQIAEQLKTEDEVIF